MAQRVEILLTDDLDGNEASQTIKFSLDGVDYEIDLNEANADKLRDCIEPYRGVARKLSKSGKPFRQVATGPDPKAVRAWAESNGIEVPARGRIPHGVVEQYNSRDSQPPRVPALELSSA